MVLPVVVRRPGERREGPYYRGLFLGRRGRARSGERARPGVRSQRGWAHATKAAAACDSCTAVR
jgi:hypothetical protein